MTALAMKTETKQMIDEMTDEHVALVFAYAKNFISEEIVNANRLAEKMAAFERMKKMRKSIDCDIDYKKEYINAITERYENIG